MQPREQLQLRSIPAFGHLTPALPLLCSELDASARELACLRPAGPTLADALPYDADAATEYTLRKQRAQLNSRALLADEEEERTLGTKVSSRPNGAMPLAGELNVPSHSSAAHEMSSIERQLGRMLRKRKRQGECSFCHLKLSARETLLATKVVSDGKKREGPLSVTQFEDLRTT